MKEVGSTHSTEKASDDRGGKGLTQIDFKYKTLSHKM